MSSAAETNYAVAMQTRVHAERPNAEGLRRDARRDRLALFGLCSPALLLVMVVMVIPVGWLFWVSFLADDGSFTFEHYLRMVESKSYARIFRNTFHVSFLTTGICILIGYPLAYLLSQLPRRAANICLITVLLPFWTSLLVRTYAWLVLLQRKGLINTWAIDAGLWDEPIKLVHNLNGTLIGMVHIMLPGLFAGALIVFVLCLGFFVTPAVLGGGKVIMVAMRIATNIEMFFNWGAASALGVVLLLLTVAILWLAARLLPMDQVMGKGRGT